MRQKEIWKQGERGLDTCTGLPGDLSSNLHVITTLYQSIL